MEMNIFVPQLDKTFTIEVGYNETLKSATNRSFANASPCCNAKLSQEKKCSACAKEVATKDVTHKILKIGKQEFFIPADRLKQIEDNIESSETEIKVVAVIKREGYELPYERVDGGKWTSPAKKRSRDYIELRELCKTHFLIAEATFKSNTYEVALVTDEVGQVIVVKFGNESRVTQRPSIDDIKDVSLNPELITLERQILDKASVPNYDFSKFEDKRTQQVDELLEKVAMGEALPDMPKAEAKKEVKDDKGELERLKALLGK